MNNLRSLALIGASALLVMGCGRIASLADDAIDAAKGTTKKVGDEAVRYSDDLVDEVVPRFDAHTPDTRFNRERYTEFFRMFPAKDVIDLFCYGDQMGPDQRFQFSFTCDSSTVNAIRLKLALHAADSTCGDAGFTVPQPWWNDAFTRASKPWCRAEDRYYRFLWYDAANRKAYYLDYDT